MRAPVRIAKPDAARAEPHRLRFSKTTLLGLRPPTSSDRFYVYDDAAPGLALCVTARGVRTFYYVARVGDRPVRIKLGRLDALSVDDARRRAAELAGDVAKGRDPAAERRAVRSEQTMRELLEHWLSNYAKLHNKRWKDQADIFDRYTESWGTRRLGSITRQTITDEHGRIGKTRPYAANRWLALVRTLYNHARRNGWTGANPASGIRHFRERSRERFIGDKDPTELGRFLAAVAAEPSACIRDFVKLLLLTGQRRSNVQAMRWGDVGLDKGVWTVPGETTKNGDPLTVALSEPAVAILRERLAARENETAWVFPSPSASGHLEEPKKAWTAILNRAGIEGLRLHDLRRTHGAIMAAGGASLIAIGRALGHKSQTATAVYARLNLDPVRQLVNGVADVLAAAEREATPDNG